MLNNLSEQIRDCYRHAQDCARKAAEHADPNLKQDFLELEESWLFLARSFKFNERIGDSSDEFLERDWFACGDIAEICGYCSKMSSRFFRIGRSMTGLGLFAI